jgi:hypothetical protein
MVQLAVPVLVVAATLAQPAASARRFAPPPLQIAPQELADQQQAFRQWWGEPLELKLAALPPSGRVPDFRIPYAGHDYPDLAGGTIAVLEKYDRAFHGGRPLAADFERRDIAEHRRGRPTEPRGLFARLAARRVPTWYGHCNGWTAAAIRHAEPQRPVVRGGVTFTPADIKGLLAELYMYCDSQFLGGVDPVIHPATLHLVLGNWIGRGGHPIGMETAVGEVVVNYPVFAYRADIQGADTRQPQVRLTITYVVNLPREQDQSPPQHHREMTFLYTLLLDAEGRIQGGRYLPGSAQIDMLWVPRAPAPGGTATNARGNPYLDVKEVLALWRESVPEEVRAKWFNIDPTEEDRVSRSQEPSEGHRPPEPAATPQGEPRPAGAPGPSTAEDDRPNRSPTAAPGSASAAP